MSSEDAVFEPGQYGFNRFFTLKSGELRDGGFEIQRTNRCTEPTERLFTISYDIGRPLKESVECCRIHGNGSDAC